jgi:4-amino-4-deoxy-L-arabinose transferase-like glycosyltransferase
VGGFVAFSVMAADTHLRFGVAVATAALALACGALSVLVRPIAREGDDVEAAVGLDRLGRPLVGAFAGCAGFLAALALAASGRLGVAGAAIAVPVSFLAFVVATFHLGAALGPWARDEAGEERPLSHRHGFWLIAITTLLYLPMLGSFTLIDPWESRYGDTAREMISRSDWISPWWAQDGWDWTKPVLDWWVQAFAMGLLGVDVRPEKIIATSSTLFARPEWAIRLPAFLFAITALYFLYKAVAGWHGRRAGLLGALVLATMPHWFLLARQSMTDMPLVAPMATAMALILVAMRVDPEARTKTYAVEIGGHTLRLDAGHLLFSAFSMLAMAQILYLVSRNVELQWVATPHGFRPHADDFASGSPGNCMLPGNERCAHQVAKYPGIQPFAQALGWTFVIGVLLAWKGRERRIARLAALGAWFFAAIATMAKGPGGLVIPMAATFAYIVACRDFKKLLVLEIPAGIGIIATLVLPWYGAMYARHGAPFTDQLVFMHMLQRATAHIHDTNEGDDVSFRYYIWQLGYALFPWTGLVPAALVGFLRAPERDEQGRALPAVLFLSWFVFAFALFASMPTKFHHYIFPAVPPAAMLTGLLLDRLLCACEPGSATDRHERRMIAALGFAAAVLVLLAGRDMINKGTASDIESQARLLHLFTYNYRRPFPDSLDFRSALLAFTVAAAVSYLLLAANRLRRYAVFASLATAVGFAVWGIDVYLVRCAPHWGQRELLTRYYSERKGPEEPFIAYQMNWKGENFYTANHVSVFVSSGQPFTSYLQTERSQGRKTFYVATEHSRADALRSEIGAHRSFERLTDARLNNKFTLVRVRFD